MIHSPIPGLTVAGPADLRRLQLLEIRMDSRWKAYLNQRVLGELGATTSERLTHLKFVPDVENGMLYVLPCQADEYGAEKLDYTAPENGAAVGMYLALLKFNLDRVKGRLRVFAVEWREIKDVGRFLALNVKESKTIPARRLQKEAESTEAPAAGVAAASEESVK